MAAGDGYGVDPLRNNASFTIVENPNIRTLVGTESDELLFGISNSENIVSQDGNDTIYGNSGEDTLLGQSGNDTIFGTTSSEFINGGYGNDIIYGNGGTDTLIGSFGDDLIYGGAGNDTIFGNGGNDLIDSGAGFDTVWLGNGSATIVLEKKSGYDTINNFQLGATQLKKDSFDNLAFADIANGVQIFMGLDLLAVVSGQSASSFNNNIDGIFIA